MSAPAQRGTATTRSARLCAGVAVAASALALAACTGTSHPATKASAASKFVATRWWSNSAATVGSRIDPKNAAAIAAKLQPSKADYCGMLSATVKAGKSILPGISATDPALLASTEAFIAEIEQVAPADVSGQWQVLGPVVVGMVRSGGVTSAMPKMDPAAVTAAATAVAKHALTVCKVDLSAIATGASGSAGTTK
jgi:hypothetical protein